MRKLRGNAVVLGAGIAGSSTALALQKRGIATTLVDPWTPGHSRAASSGDHRVHRSSHGADELYARWSAEARLRWLELQERAGIQLFVQSGCVLMAHEHDTSWEDASSETLGRLGIPAFKVSAEELRLRLPIVDTSGIAYGLWEPESGFVFARRALEATIQDFVDRGGELQVGALATDGDERPMLNGSALEADVIVCACGAWMRQLFRRTLGPILEISRQDVILVAPPSGSNSYEAENMPAWIDHGYPAYGIPAVGGHGFKAVIVWRGLDIDLEHDDRTVSPTAVARTRRYLAHRFPALVDRPIVGQEVGQIANTPDTHFVIDRHPDHPNVVLVAGDSGHLLKHGPVLGEHVADLALTGAEPESRFRLGRRSSVALVDRPQ